MASPAYQDIGRDAIPRVEFPGGHLDVIGGAYEGARGFQGRHVPAQFYAIRLEPGRSLSLPVGTDHSAVVFTLLGDAVVAGEAVAEKTAVSTTDGGLLELQAGSGPADLLFLSAPRLNEPIAWGGPIVMNTQTELRAAFEDLRRGDFLKKSASNN